MGVKNAAEGNPLAQRGYSRDHRPDCKQVCIGLVVSKCGMPLGYEVFAGNRVDVTTLQEIVQTMERRYTLVLTWVRRHESMVCVLRRMVARIGLVELFRRIVRRTRRI